MEGSAGLHEGGRSLVDGRCETGATGQPLGPSLRGAGGREPRGGPDGALPRATGGADGALPRAIGGADGALLRGEGCVGSGGG